MLQCPTSTPVVVNIQRQPSRYPLIPSSLRYRSLLAPQALRLCAQRLRLWWSTSTLPLGHPLAQNSVPSASIPVSVDNPRARRSCYQSDLESNLHSSIRPTTANRAFFFTTPATSPLTICPPSSLARVCSPLMMPVDTGANASALSAYLLRGSGESPLTSDQPKTQTSQAQATGALDMRTVRFPPSLGQLERGTSCVECLFPG